MTISPPTVSSEPTAAVLVTIELILVLVLVKGRVLESMADHGMTLVLLDRVLFEFRDHRGTERGV